MSGVDQGQSFGAGDEGAKQAAADLIERRRQTGTGNADADDFLEGRHHYEVVARDDEASKDRLKSRNPNAPGDDPKAAAKELASYRRNLRDPQMTAELANLGVPVAPVPEAQEGAQPQPEQPQPQQPTEHPEVVAERQRAQAAVAEAQIAAAQAQQHHLTAAQALIVQAFNEGRNEFSDIQTYQDAEILRQVDPARWQRLVDLDQKYQAGVRTVQALQQHQQTHQQQAFTQWAQAEDAKFDAAVPALRDPTRRAQTARAVVDLAQKEYGVSLQELQHAWNTNPAVRSAPFQRMMFDALQFHEARGSAKKPSPKPIPTVQRPGVRRPAGADAMDAEFEHLRDLEKGGGVRSAAALLVARRNARD